MRKIVLAYWRKHYDESSKRRDFIAFMTARAGAKDISNAVLTLSQENCWSIPLKVLVPTSTPPKLGHEFP